MAGWCQTKPKRRLRESAETTKDKLLFTAVEMFSAKGYSNVGIRKLCAAVGIKESSFYNHFTSKKALFEAILNHLVVEGDQIVMDQKAIEITVSQMPFEVFMEENLRRINEAFRNPLFLAIIRLTVMESYINPIAYEFTESTSYDHIKDNMTRILKGYMDKGEIVRCEVDELLTAYFYGIKTFNDQYMLNDAWNKDQAQVQGQMKRHNAFFTNLLKGGTLI